MLFPAAVSAALLASTAGAQQTQESPALELGAFGTLGTVHSSESQADFARTTLLPRGAGASTDWALNVDSLIGAQLRATASPRLSAVVQAVAEYDYDNRFRPHVEWANLSFALTPDLSLRVGRIALPVFMYTDTRRLGFALPWVRTPAEVYELIPFTSNDGVDVVWGRTMGPGRNTLQLAYGRSETRFKDPADVTQAIETRDQFIVATTYEIHDLTLRINYGQAHFRIDALDPLFDGFRQFGAAGEAVADRFEAQGGLGRFIGASLLYDPGAWYVLGEWGHLHTDNIAGNRGGWYVSGGLRLRSFTPYLTHGRIGLNSPAGGQGLDLAALPPELVPMAAALNAALDAELNSVPRQRTWSVGLRWDLTRQTAVKAQVDHIDLAPGSYGTFTFRQPGYVPGGSARLFSLTFDFVL